MASFFGRLFGGGTTRAASSTQAADHDVEMTTYSETTIRRSRSGSFTGHIEDSPQGTHTGYSDFRFSKRTGVFDVNTIVSNSPGGGRRMMDQMEGIARQHGATTMEAATSRPGFFKKVGFDYTAAQHVINARKYTAAQLQEQENNRGEGGGAFSMFKDL